MTNTDDPIVGLPPDLEIHEGILAQSNQTWHLPRDVWRPIREQGQGEGVKVAVLDTGMYQHPSLPKPLAMESWIRGQSPADPQSGHGTHCAGTVLSRDEDIGVAPKADILVGKVLSNQGSGSSSGIAAGVRWAVDQGADVISMSLGGGSRYEPTINAIKYAFSKGRVVVIAAGNSGYSGRGNTIGWPARSAEGICVAALNSNGVPANFSSGGEQITIAAPGQSILSCDNDSAGWRMMSGTSMATPFVAGCFAVIISKMRELGRASWTSVEAVNKFIETNATDLLNPGKDTRTGHGMFTMMEIMTMMSKGDLKYA